MTVVDFDERTITFVHKGQNVTLTWGEINFLKHYKEPGFKRCVDKYYKPDEQQ